MWVLLLNQVWLNLMAVRLDKTNGGLGTMMRYLSYVASHNWLDVIDQFRVHTVTPPSIYTFMLYFSLNFLIHSMSPSLSLFTMSSFSVSTFVGNFFSSFLRIFLALFRNSKFILPINYTY